MIDITSDTIRFLILKTLSPRPCISSIKWGWWAKFIVVYYFCHRLPITFLTVRESLIIELVLTIIADVFAGIILYFVCKWLDGKKQTEW